MNVQKVINFTLFGSVVLVSNSYDVEAVLFDW